MAEPFPVITLLNAVTTEATRTSEVMDIRHLDGAGLWVAFETSGWVAGTDFVGNFAVLGGVEDDINAMRELPIVAADLIPATLPTGMAVDAAADGIDIANTLGNSGDVSPPVFIPYGGNRPPFIAVKLTRTSGGSSTAYVTVKIGAGS